MTPAEIVSTGPHLRLADIHAALACYHDHRTEIEADLAEGERLYAELKTKQPSILEKISNSWALARGTHGASAPVEERPLRALAPCGTEQGLL
jgi:hypothetical protein